MFRVGDLVEVMALDGGPGCTSAKRGMRGTVDRPPEGEILRVRFDRIGLYFVHLKNMGLVAITPFDKSLRAYIRKELLNEEG